MSLALAKVDANDIRDLAESVMALLVEGKVAAALRRAKEITRLAADLERRLGAPEGRGK